MSWLFGFCVSVRDLTVSYVPRCNAEVIVMENLYVKSSSLRLDFIVAELAMW